jgi:hypothetical protein
VMRDSRGSAQWPMLTKTNYTDWALLMQVMLEARQLWTAIDVGTAEREADMQAREALLHLRWCPHSAPRSRRKRPEPRSR